MSTRHAAEQPPTEPWSVVGSVLLAALYVWTAGWLLLAVVLPAVGLGWQPVVITSGSMEPLIQPGDVVLGVAPGELLPGHVITYEDPARAGTLTTHRVVSVTEDGALRTQGDANARPDSTLVPAEDVVGRGRLLVPVIGLPLVWLMRGGVEFALWLVLSAAALVVLLDRGGSRRPRRVALRRPGRLRNPLRRLHDAVYSGPRPDAGRMRRAAPTAVVVALAGWFARTPGTVLASAVALGLVLLLDPDGPQLRIARLRRVGAAAALFVVAAGPAVGRSTAAYSSAVDTTGSSFLASAAFAAEGLTLWLAGTDTSPSISQPTLAMRTVPPSLATQPNHDTDRDDAPGLLVSRGGADVFENDPKKVQRWVHVPAQDLTIASARVVFHSAVDDFATARSATVAWYLRHCAADGVTCVELADGAVTEADWHAGQGGFIERTLSFGPLAHTVPAGRHLELAVVVPDAQDHHRIAYGAVAEPSRLELELPTQGACPGAGAAVQHVVADTFVEQDDPDRVNGGGADVDVVSEVGKNHRGLLTVWLPSIPAGCTMTSATLHVTVTDVAEGRTLLAQRLAASVDVETVTWSTQPEAVGAIATTTMLTKGAVALDVTGPVGELYTVGNTGLLLRDGAEDAPAAARNRFRSVDADPYPDVEGPRLEVTWGP